MLGLRWAQRAKAWFVTLRIFLGRLPVTVLKSLNDRQSGIFLKFKESKEHIHSNYDMSIKSCQAIQRSCLDRESNAWFTLGSESESMVVTTVSWHLNYFLSSVTLAFGGRFLAEETKEVIQATVELFKKHNKSRQKLWCLTRTLQNEKYFKSHFRQQLWAFASTTR